MKILLCVIAATGLFLARADCAAKSKSCCTAPRRIIGGCCRKWWNPIQSTEDAPWKVVPYDIQMLSDDSLVKQRYVKCFDLIGKSTKSWIRKDYAARRVFFEGSLWEGERKKLEDALNRNTRLSREPAVTKEEVLKMAEEMVIYGRGLTVGNSCGIGIREVADLYRFDNVSRFLKDATEYSRYRRKGFAKGYPSDDPEFRDFETLVKLMNPVEWDEFRAKLAEMNKTYEDNQAREAAARRAKAKRKRSF